MLQHVFHHSVRFVSYKIEMAKEEEELLTWITWSMRRMHHAISSYYKILLSSLQFDEKVIDLEAELVKTKKQTDDLRKNNKKSKVRAEKFQHQCDDLQKRLVSSFL